MRIPRQRCLLLRLLPGRSVRTLMGWQAVGIGRRMERDLFAMRDNSDEPQPEELPMMPIEFAGQNVVFAKDQPEYLPLPAMRTLDGEVTSCWGMTWRERLRVLWTRRVYITLLTFGEPLQPQIVSTQPPATPSAPETGGEG